MFNMKHFIDNYTFATIWCKFIIYTLIMSIRSKHTYVYHIQFKEVNVVGSCG